MDLAVSTPIMLMLIAGRSQAVASDDRILACRGRWGRPPRLCRGSRACESLSSVLLLDPVHGGGHAEHAHEAAGRLLVACRDRAPLLEPGPETLDAVAVDVDPGRARDGRFIALGRGPRHCLGREARRARAELPDVVAECLTGVAAIGHDP